MKLTKLKLADLKKPEKNVRIKEFIRSIDHFGQIRPIVVDENYVILAGNGLYAAMCARGDTEAECYVVKGLSENEKKKLMLADNKIYSLGIDDMDAFEDLLKELDGDLEIPGYDPELLETITADMDDVDDMLSGYGVVSESTKKQIESTAQRYEAQEEQHASEAEEIKPQSPAPESPAESHGEPLPKRFIQCPKCGEKIWL